MQLFFNNVLTGSQYHAILKIVKERELMEMRDGEIIYGCDLPKLSNEELLQYYQKLTEAIVGKWSHEGRYILRDCAKYEILQRMGR